MYMLSIPWHQRHWKQSRVQFRLELMDDLIFGTFRTFLLQCQSLSTKSELTSNFICLFYQFLHRINSIFACCRRQKTSIGKHAPNLLEFGKTSSSKNWSSSSSTPLSESMKNQILENFLARFFLGLPSF